MAVTSKPTAGLWLVYGRRLAGTAMRVVRCLKGQPICQVGADGEDVQCQAVRARCEAAAPFLTCSMTERGVALPIDRRRENGEVVAGGQFTVTRKYRNHLSLDP